jgi:hypothetical protein
MNEHEHELIDINEKARKTGIDMPVAIEPALLEKLRPSPYLLSLGVTLEQRVENLLALAKMNLKAQDWQNNAADQKYYLPLMIVKGPLVAEAFFPVIARVAIGEGNRPSIALVEAGNTE